MSDEILIQNKQGETTFIMRDDKEFALIDGKEVPVEELYRKKAKKKGKEQEGESSDESGEPK